MNSSFARVHDVIPKLSGNVTSEVLCVQPNHWSTLIVLCIQGVVYHPVCIAFGTPLSTFLKYCKFVNLGAGKMVVIDGCEMCIACTVRYSAMLFGAPWGSIRVL